MEGRTILPRSAPCPTARREPPGLEDSIDGVLGHHRLHDRRPDPRQRWHEVSVRFRHIRLAALGQRVIGYAVVLATDSYLSFRLTA